MRKPILLLVDDEPAVLEALEAELRPHFEELCRIEVFDNPLDLPDALPRWSQEERAVAVAIVDQKMPGITGVDLLARLKAAGPCAHMRSAILTGYAGLASALTAKNEAGVDRYLEKPWSGDHLIDEVATLLEAHLVESGADRYFEFRQTSSVDEVRSHLRLRHEVYRLTAGSHLLAQAVDLDIDPFDLVSQLFGFFAEGLTSAMMVGTLRVTGQEEGPWTTMLEQALEEQPELLAAARSRRACPLPMMKYLMDGEAVAALIAALTGRSESVVEAGRLTLHPGFRSTVPGSGLRHLALHIIESAAANVYLIQGIDNVLLTCCPPHDLLYRRLGFQDAEGTSRRFHAAFGAVVVCLHGKSGQLPPSPRQKVQSLAARVARSSAACHCPTFPDCLGGPYETGDFRETDLFCPLRARQILSAGHARIPKEKTPNAREKAPSP